jgi:hypothetical protein
MHASGITLTFSYSLRSTTIEYRHTKKHLHILYRSQHMNVSNSLREKKLLMAMSETKTTKECSANNPHSQQPNLHYTQIAVAASKETQYLFKPSKISGTDVRKDPLKSNPIIKTNQSASLAPLPNLLQEKVRKGLEQDTFIISTAQSSLAFNNLQGGVLMLK